MASERQLSVSTHSLTDDDLIWLGNLGQLDSIKYTWTYPGGSAAFNANLTVDPNFRHRALTPGRLLRVWCGGVCVWKGTLDLPKLAGSTVALSGTGNSSAGEDFVAYATDNSLKAEEEVFFALFRGLPWKAALTYPPIWGVADSASKTIAESVQYTADFSGQPWTVAVDGQLGFNPPPTKPQLMLLALSSGGGRSTEDYADRIVGIYDSAIAPPVLAAPTTAGSGGHFAADTYFYRVTGLDANGGETTGSNEVSHAVAANGTISLTWTASPFAVKFNVYRASSAAHTFLGGENELVGTTTNLAFTDTGADTQNIQAVPTANTAVTRGITAVSNDAAILAHGTREQSIDYTQFGGTDEAHVNQTIAPVLAKFGFRARWSDAFTCPAGSICTLGGTPVDLAFVRPGLMFGVQVVDVDGGGEVDPTAVSFIAGETEYDADSDSLTLTPQEAKLTDLSSLTVDPRPRQKSLTGR